eukprot:scaffold8763_cov119-Isochrysis_galbana.AAC.6
MVCGVVLWPRAGTHQPPPSPSTPRACDGTSGRRARWCGGFKPTCISRRPVRVVGGAVVERCALTHQPPKFLLLSSPVPWVGWSPRGG